MPDTHILHTTRSMNHNPMQFPFFDGVFIRKQSYVVIVQQEKMMDWISSTNVYVFPRNAAEITWKCESSASKWE